MNLEAFLVQHSGWQVANEAGGAAIEKTWRFADFRAAMAFANEVAALADRLDHHPAMTITWGRCTVCWTTHDTGGLTAKDFDAAHQTDLLATGAP